MKINKLYFIICAITLYFILFYVHLHLGNVSPSYWIDVISNENIATVPLSEQFLINQSNILINSHIVNYKSKSKAIVMVMTGRYNFIERHAVRESWAKGYDNVIFILGNSSCLKPAEYRKPYSCDDNGAEQYPGTMQKYVELDIELRRQLHDEMIKFADIVELPFQDSYRNLPLKLKHGYDWIVKNTNASWILKVDDDTVAFIDNLNSFTKEFKPNMYYFIGRMSKNAKVLRYGKWAELDYKPTKYPKFALGSSGHLVSRNIAEYISRNKERLYNYQGEDTSLGIWLSEAPFVKNITYGRTSRFDISGNCKLKNRIVIGHGISPEKMMSCFANNN